VRINTPAGLRALTGATILMAIISAAGFAGEASSATSLARSTNEVLFARGQLERMFTRYQHRLLAGRVHSHVHPVMGAVDYGTATNRFDAPRPGHMHGGQDVFAPTGTPLVAVSRGVVVETGSDGGRGNYVAIYDPRAKRTYWYFHMVGPARVAAGERVKPGQRIGAVGCTGHCDGPHLHFEVHLGRGETGKGIDPLPLLRRWKRAH
jgi:murein DD-endopeptidase MepM/ murein hydrolase activator NlpD